jgi:chemotaxis protein histidine kinase CheA
MAGLNIQEALGHLKQEFIDNSAEQLDKIDAMIDRLYVDSGESRADFMAFQRDVHSLKGAAGMHGFASVSVIAHRLEDYFEALPQLSASALADVQAYIDAMRAILETGNELPADRLDPVLRGLPQCQAQTTARDPGRRVVALLVMPKGTWRSLVSTELSAAGYELAFSDEPVQAFGLAVTVKPDLIVSSVEFDKLSGPEFASALQAIKATAKTPIILLTSHSVEALQAILPAGATAIHKDAGFASALAVKLTGFGLPVRVPAQAAAE